jgi:hypothetical protein
MGGHAERKCDVLVVRCGCPSDECLELVVALAGQVVLGVAVAGQILVGDAHAPDAQRLPALLLRVQPRRDAWFDPPELLLAVLAVVVPVVRYPAGRAGLTRPSH